VSPTLPVPAGARRSPARDGDASPVSRNEVVLVGRLSTAAQERELPSGDVLTAFRVVVDRPPARRPPPEGVRTPTVDSVACVAWTASLRRTALALAPGDVVEVRGAVRQRFWRTGAGVGSRTEVEVSALQRLQRA
jgi:single-strand DNA-binding protein